MKINLSIIEGPRKGEQFEFDQADRFLVGRSLQSHFQMSPDDPYVSRNHMLLEIRPPYCYIRDNNSTNGTFIKGSTDKEFIKVTEKEVKDGDLIRIGKTVLKVNVVKSQTPVYAPEPTDRVFCIRCGNDITEILKNKQAADLHISDYICQECKRRDAEKVKQVTSAIKMNYICRGCNKDLTRIANSDGRAAELTDVVFYLCENCSSRQQEQVDLSNIKEYKLLKEIGKGGMGVVYKAWHKPTGRIVAIKKMLPGVAMDEKASKLFQREMAVMSDLIHPNIVRLIDQGMIGREHYFVSEYLPDGDTDELVLKIYKGPVPIREACDLICQALRGLDFAHSKSFVHRDIKPPNLLLTKNKRGERIAKLTDFGLSKNYEKAGHSGLTQRGETSGTPFFMAPEQFTNYRYVKPPADVYSMAVTLYYLLTAKYQFHFPTPLDVIKGALKEKKPKDPILVILEDPPLPIQEQNPNIPSALAEVVDRAIRKDERERFQTARELEDAIKSVFMKL
jgi:serine/threonine-protein kinase